MVLIYDSDINPILISCVVFSSLAFAHRILVPGKYSSYLQFKEEVNSRKTAQSTAIRIIYLIVGTLFLNLLLGYTEKQIGLGVFIVCFLNVWPSIIQNQLFKLLKTGREVIILFGYLLFIGASVFVIVLTIRLFIPLLKGDITIYWLDNQAISFLSSLCLMALPIPVETLVAKYSRMVVVQTIDTFMEEIYILEHQLPMKNYRIEKNKYLIDEVARENDINAKLLESVLKLEIFYRGRIYNRLLEWFICKFFTKAAISNDISVGMAQIKISTAEQVLRQNANMFIQNICKDEFNIKVCGKLLKNLINQYNDAVRSNDHLVDEYVDVYDYLSCKYLGADIWHKNKTALIYSAVLRSNMCCEEIEYTGTEQLGRYLIVMSKKGKFRIKHDEFKKLLDDLDNDIVIQKEIFVDKKELYLEIIGNRYNNHCIKDVKKFAKKHNCIYDIFPK